MTHVVYQVSHAQFPGFEDNYDSLKAALSAASERYPGAELEGDEHEVRAVKDGHTVATIRPLGSLGAPVLTFDGGGK